MPADNFNYDELLEGTVEKRTTGTVYIIIGEAERDSHYAWPARHPAITPAPTLEEPMTQRMEAKEEMNKEDNEDTISQLMNDLNSSNDHVQSHAAQRLGELRAARAIPALANLLRLAGEGEGAGIASAPMHAAWALRDIGAPSVESLLAALRDGNEHVQVLASYALMEIGQPAVDQLIGVVNDDPNVDVRRKAVWVLWEIGDKRAVESYIRALRYDPDNKVRRYIASALGQELMTDERAIEPLIAALDDDDPVSWNAAVSLQRYGRKAVEPLIAALFNGTLRVRQGAANALAWLMDATAIDSLIAALRDENAKVRSRAAFALGWIMDRRAVEPLIAALHDEDEEVRMQVIAALGWIKDPRAVEPLVKLIQDENYWVLYAAAEALVDIGDVSAIKPLMLSLSSKRQQVREAAEKALLRMGYPLD